MIPETPEKPADPATFWQLASAIWLSPATVGEAIARRVPWRAVTLAAGIIVAVMLGASWMCRDQIIADSLEMVRAKSDVPAEQIEAMEKFFASSFGKTVIAGQNAVFSLVGFALIGLGLYLGQLVMGGRASFGQAVAVTVFSCLISFAAGWTLRTALVLYQGSFMAVSTGLGVLIDAPMHDPLRACLDLIDPLSLWAVYSAGTALAAPARLGRGQALGVSVAVYVLLGGLGTVLRIVGGQ